MKLQPTLVRENIMKQLIIKSFIFTAALSLYSCTSTSKHSEKVASAPEPIKSAAPAVEPKCVVESVELSNEIWTKRPSGYTATEESRFFAENAKREDVFTLASGVQYKVLRQGCGKNPTLTSVVKNRYHMTLLNGKVIDSSYNRKEAPSFVLGSVIPGWSEAVSFMQVGAIWEIYIPSQLAYGSAGMGPVPKNSPLLFTVELIDFN